MQRLIGSLLLVAALVAPLSACTDGTDPVSPSPLPLVCQAWQAQYSVIGEVSGARTQKRLLRVWLKSQPEACPLPAEAGNVTA